jgi:tetratricopeptide (TPR) repeat protein
MVATTDIFQKSKEFFENGDIINTLICFDEIIEHYDSKKGNKKNELIQFLNDLLQHCRDNNLQNEEAMVLRTLGRTHTKFKDHVKGLKYSYQALKIQKKLGKKLDVAESLVFLAEDLEVSGNYEEVVKSFNEAADLFHELGELEKEDVVRIEIERLKDFSKQMVDDEYFLNKYQVDKY